MDMLSHLNKGVGCCPSSEAYVCLWIGWLEPWKPGANPYFPIGDAILHVPTHSSLPLWRVHWPSNNVENYALSVLLASSIANRARNNANQLALLKFCTAKGWL